MKYIVLSNERVAEILPESDPIFPGVSVEQRYSKEFLMDAISVQDDADVQQNMLYDAETGEFSWPEPPAPVEHGPVIPPEPSQEERNRADIDYLALMMGVELP